MTDDRRSAIGARRHDRHRRRRLAGHRADARRSPEPGSPWRRTGTIRALVDQPRRGRPAPRARRARRAGRRRHHRPADPSIALFAGLTGIVDVIHTAGVIHPRTIADFEAVNAGGTRQRAGARASGRRAAVRARVVEQPVRHQPPPAATVPQRRAVPPVLRLRHARRCTPSCAVLDAVAAGPRRRDGAPAVVLRPAPAAAPDHVLHRWCAPAGSRSSATATSAVDGVRRQPRAGHRARRADARPMPGLGWWIADARPYTRHRDRRDGRAGRSPTRASR